MTNSPVTPPRALPAPVHAWHPSRPRSGRSAASGGNLDWRTLTAAEGRVLWVVSAWSGYPPSVRDVAAAAGDPLATVHDALARLRDLGLVTWEPRKERTLRSTMTVVR